MQYNYISAAPVLCRLYYGVIVCELHYLAIVTQISKCAIHVRVHSRRLHYHQLFSSSPSLLSPGPFRLSTDLSIVALPYPADNLSSACCLLSRILVSPSVSSFSVRLNVHFPDTRPTVGCLSSDELR